MIASDTHAQSAASPKGPLSSRFVTRRLVCALVLVPIVPSVSFVGVVFIKTHLGIALWDEMRWLHLLMSSLWVGATIAIWRSAILWTLGRKWLTALVTAVPFVQVVYAQPLWKSGGCMSGLTDDLLRHGQEDMGLGLWIWLSVWVWWGWEKRAMSKEQNAESSVSRMSPIAMRIVASIGCIPFVFGAFLVVGILFDKVLNISNEPGTEALAVSAFVAILLWVLIWRGVVVFSTIAVMRTIWIAALCLGLPILLQGLLYRGYAAHWDAVLNVLPVIGWGMFMGLTIKVWPIRPGVTAGARALPRCMRCGYLLTGLKATRCPECGDEPTLDELWSATACDV